jgi:hypothetical protein
MLAGASQASAVTRYAAPGGSSDPSACIDPDLGMPRCSIFDAAQGSGVQAGDSVVIEPGSYSDTAGDLGPNGAVVPVAQTVTGPLPPATVVKEGRPKITLNGGVGSGGPAFVLFDNHSLSYMEINTTGSAQPEAFSVVGNGSVDQVIARTDSQAGGDVCKHSGGTIRDTVCLSTTFADALGANTSLPMSTTRTLRLRNVTAVASGSSNAHGISYVFSGASVSVSVDAKSVIALGGTDDVRAAGNSGASTTLTFDHSDYATVALVGTATVTNPGDNNGQTTAPMLAADGFHQLAGSITIGNGAVDAFSGTTDIDGNARPMSGSDIGADELVAPTGTAVSCSPASVTLGGLTDCAITVTDTAPSGNTTPTGTAGLSSDLSPNFPGSHSCNLVMIGLMATSGCTVAYTPLIAGTHQVVAEYLADATHEPSQASTSISALSPPPSTGGGSAPAQTSSAPAPAGATKKCKKGRKLKHGRCVKKKKKR